MHEDISNPAQEPPCRAGTCPRRPRSGGQYRRTSLYAAGSSCTGGDMSPTYICCIVFRGTSTRADRYTRKRHIDLRAYVPTFVLHPCGHLRLALRLCSSIGFSFSTLWLPANRFQSSASSSGPPSSATEARPSQGRDNSLSCRSPYRA